MDELNDLLKELEGIKAKQKALNERESSIKEEIMELLKEGGHDKAESLYGTVRLQRRYEKDYGDEIRTMEIKLKEAKKLADDMGDFQLMGFTESIVYVPPKDIL